jgi:hypothetical protein
MGYWLFDSIRGISPPSCSATSEHNPSPRSNPRLRAFQALRSGWLCEVAQVRGQGAWAERGGPLHPRVSASDPYAAEKAKRRMAMKQAKQAEPPSWFRPPVFMIGQNRRGNWVVRDQKGVCGGLFVSREAALRFIRAENGYRPQAVVMVSENLELDMSGSPSKLSRRETSGDLRRRIA